MQRDTLIERYAKKVFGFAVRKSNSRQDAEDLSQSILTALCETDWEKKAIADMDGYIYRICLNTYYTRLRKAARYWECVDYDALPEQADGSKTPEEALLHREDLQKLRREVMRLCRLRREAIVLFYYEHKSGREIDHPQCLARQMRVGDAVSSLVFELVRQVEQLDDFLARQVAEPE